MSNYIFNNTLDEFLETQAMGSNAKAIGNNLYGINHRQIDGMVPVSKDSHGLIFFTRPQLNMLSTNLRNARKMYDLLTDKELSIQRYVRCTLDPRLAYGTRGGPMDNQLPITTPLVDPEQAFIPLLTNSFKSISGWPDIEVPTYQSSEGLYKEVYTQADGVTDIYNSYDITCTFENMRGDPIMYMFYVWTRYMAYVFEGILTPWPDFIVNNLLDYNTRIYRITLDVSKKYVTRVAACGAAFPVNVPISQAFDFKKDSPYNDQNKEISIRFKCVGCDYYDAITMLEFNRTVGLFNPAMRCGKFGQIPPNPSMVVKVPSELLPIFNFRGYPRINLEDGELEWWVPLTVWADRATKYLNITSTGPVYNPSKIANSNCPKALDLQEQLQSNVLNDKELNDYLNYTNTNGANNGEHIRTQH